MSSSSSSSSSCRRNTCFSDHYYHYYYHYSFTIHSPWSGSTEACSGFLSFLMGPVTWANGSLDLGTMLSVVKFLRSVVMEDQLCPSASTPGAPPACHYSPCTSLRLQGSLRQRGVRVQGGARTARDQRVVGAGVRVLAAGVRVQGVGGWSQGAKVLPPCGWSQGAKVLPPCPRGHIPSPSARGD